MLRFLSPVPPACKFHGARDLLFPVNSPGLKQYLQHSNTSMETLLKNYGLSTAPSTIAQGILFNSHTDLIRKSYNSESQK